MKRTLVLTTLLCSLTAGSALAQPINDRLGDITPNPSSDPTEKSLQRILDDYVTPPTGAYDAVTDQSKQALWTTTDATSASYLVSLFTAHSNGILGIYTPEGKSYNLIDRLTTSTASSFTFAIDAFGNLRRDDDILVSGFGKVFGFFWKDTQHSSDASYIAYTEDTKNTVGTSDARALVYQLVSGTKVDRLLPDGSRSEETMTGGNDWIMSFEDHPWGDGDYNDATFLVKDIAPVPEPGTMMLLGAGFLGLAIYGKRRKNA